MFDAGVSGRIIRQRTGNRSIEGICIYKQQFLLIASTTTASTKPLAASCILTPPHHSQPTTTVQTSLLIDHFQSVCLPPIYLTQAEKNVS